jgi:hypothetical protein
MWRAISVYAHHDDLWSFAQLAISIPGRRKRLTFDHTHGQRTNAYKSVRGSWLTSLTIILFTRVAPHTKNKGALDQCSTHLLLLLACASPRTKSKGLHSYVLQIYYFINQVFKSFCNSAGIIIVGLALPQISWARLLVFIGTRRNKWARDRHLLWSGISAPIDS